MNNSRFLSSAANVNLSLSRLLAATPCSYNHLSNLMFEGCPHCFIDQDIDNGFLVAGNNVFQLGLGEMTSSSLPSSKRCFQAAEAEIGRVFHRPRKLKRAGTAFFAIRSITTSRIPQIKKFGCLIKRLSCSIVVSGQAVEIHGSFEPGKYWCDHRKQPRR